MSKLLDESPDVSVGYRRSRPRSPFLTASSKENRLEMGKKFTNMKILIRGIFLL